MELERSVFRSVIRVWKTVQWLLPSTGVTGVKVPGASCDIVWTLDTIVTDLC